MMLLSKQEIEYELLSRSDVPQIPTKIITDQKKKGQKDREKQRTIWIYKVLESVGGAAREGADPEEADLNKLPNPSSSLLSSPDVVPGELDLPK